MRRDDGRGNLTWVRCKKYSDRAVFLGYTCHAERFDDPEEYEYRSQLATQVPPVGRVISYIDDYTWRRVNYDQWYLDMTW